MMVIKNILQQKNNFLIKDIAQNKAIRCDCI
jgi:hypothetical protein